MPPIKTPIDKDAEYEVSVTLKNLIQQEDANNRIYIGIESLDENGARINTDSENFYNYGVVENKLLSSNETLTFSGKFKGFNPRTIVPEGEETGDWQEGNQEQHLMRWPNNQIQQPAPPAGWSLRFPKVIPGSPAGNKRHES